MPKIGQKGRKIGRAGRKPAHKRYNMEQRWLKNKARKIAKQKRFEEKKRRKKEKVKELISTSGI